MGRSNNQLRRTAKQKGKVFLPKKVKSSTKNQLRKLRVMAITNDPKLNRKLSYDKYKTKTGKVVQRKFRAGGYNKSGKFGKKTSGAKGRGGKRG